MLVCEPRQSQGKLAVQRLASIATDDKRNLRVQLSQDPRYALTSADMVGPRRSQALSFQVPSHLGELAAARRSPPVRNSGAGPAGSSAVVTIDRQGRRELRRGLGRRARLECSLRGGRRGSASGSPKPQRRGRGRIVPAAPDPDASGWNSEAHQRSSCRRDGEGLISKALSDISTSFSVSSPWSLLRMFA